MSNYLNPEDLLVEEPGSQNTTPTTKEPEISFCELAALGAKEALGSIKCTYLELFANGNFKKKHPKNNIIYSLQSTDVMHLILYCKEYTKVVSDDVALFMANTLQTPCEKTGYVLIQLNIQLLDTLQDFKKKYWYLKPKDDNLIALYKALYCGPSYELYYNGEVREFKSYNGLRTLFYINPNAAEWFPIVEKTVTVEQPTNPDGNTIESNPEVDVYEPEKTDTQVKKNNTKTLAMLAIAALSLFN